MSSKRHLRRKACEGKKRHLTREHALIALEHTHGDGLNVYYCKWCHRWHVGHPDKKTRTWHFNRVMNVA